MEKDWWTKMTEERMIRVFDFYDEDVYALPAWFIKKFVQIEPAPPKDWQPICFTDPLVIGECLGSPSQICSKCPYRKTEALK